MQFLNILQLPFYIHQLLQALHIRGIQVPRRFLYTLTEFDEEIERNNYIEAVAAAYHVGIEDLRKLVGTRLVLFIKQPCNRPV